MDMLLYCWDCRMSFLRSENEGKCLVCEIIDKQMSLFTKRNPWSRVLPRRGAL